MRVVAYWIAPARYHLWNLRWRLRAMRRQVLRAAGVRQRIPGIDRHEGEFALLRDSHRHCCAGACWFPAQDGLPEQWVNVIAGGEPRWWDEPLAAYLDRIGARP